MKCAVLFSGQGAQYVGMGQDLYQNYYKSQRLFDQAADLLDWDVKEVCFQDSKELIHQTRYTQTSLFTTELAIYEVLKDILEEANIKVEATLGFSLGEYSAIVASGALAFGDALSIVEKRAIYMHECALKTKGGMAAVMGLEIEQIRNVCKIVSEEGHYIDVANDNCAGQVTISGVEEGLDVAIPLLKEKGARRVVRLAVSGAFHSELMKPAAEALEKDLQKQSFKPVTLPIVSNVTAQYMDQEEILTNIPLQIVRGVRFRESILYLLSQGFDTFIEVGPKKTLINLVKKITKEASVFQVEDQATLEEFKKQIGGLQC